MTVVNLMDYLGDSVKEEELAEGMQGDSHGHTHSHAQEDDDHDEAHDAVMTTVKNIITKMNRI